MIARARQTPLTDAEFELLTAAIQTLGHVAQLIEDKTATIARLRQLLFGAATEKTRAVLARAGPSAPAAGADRPGGPEREDPGARRGNESTPGGHGRHGAEAYAGAEHVAVPHFRLKHGDRCPGCAQGKVYAQREPGVLIRLRGQAPLAATVYALEKLRCNLCGEIFTADPPPGVGPEKYDATSASMIALLKYGSGVPFHRLERLQATLAIPLPASTQWEIVATAAPAAQPALEELIRQAAHGDVLHNDDTGMTVLGLAGAARVSDVGADAPERTGIFTSGIVATRAGHRVALFFTGHRHAGENLAQVLAHRAADLGPPIQMCDALSRNLPKPLAVILGNCLAHARRKFVEVTPNFPAECRYVLETLRAVYHHDAQARQDGLTPAARLAWHQAQSGPLMEKLHVWLTDQIAEHRVEPNSGLGQAIAYFLKHWTPLTLFLRQPGAPLDNNVVERALKKAIVHRKNALFYKTANGAHVGRPVHEPHPHLRARRRQRVRVPRRAPAACRRGEADAGRVAAVDLPHDAAAARGVDRFRIGSQTGIPLGGFPSATRSGKIVAGRCSAMGRTTAKAKTVSCTNCAGTVLVRRITTYPVRLTAPAPLIGKEIHVHRVALHECQSCGHLMPTPAGQAKVARCVQQGIDFFLGRLR